jgi:hypothetical protein
MTELEALKIVHTRAVQCPPWRDGKQKWMPPETLEQLDQALDQVADLIERVEAAEKDRDKRYAMAIGVLVEAGWVVVDTIEIDQIRDASRERDRADLADRSNTELGAFIDQSLTESMASNGYSDVLAEAREEALDYIEEWLA